MATFKMANLIDACEPTACTMNVTSQAISATSEVNERKLTWFTA